MLWKSALKEAESGQKILIATCVGSHLAMASVESMIAAALTLRGADVHFLLCDGVLPACLGCWTDIYADHKKFAETGPGKDCDDCFKSAINMLKPLGLTFHRFSDYLSEDEIGLADKISSTLPYDEIRSYTYNDMAIGEHALAGALRFFARGDLQEEEFGEQILRRYFNASLRTTFATQNLIKKQPFNVSLFNHGIYVPHGLIGEVCRKNGVHVINWNPAYRKKCFIFSHHETYHHTMMTESIASWETVNWNERLEADLFNYLKSRWEGTNDWIWFHEKPKFDLEDIKSRTGIDFTKPCIGLLTSVMWDAVLHYPSNAFSNMLEWVNFTIEYFLNRPEIQLIIRIHPAELRGNIPSRQRIADEIQRRYPNLPNNIIVIPPESDISTYAMMMECDSVIIYNTKTGVELAAMGIPIIVAGEAWIRNKGFAIDVNNPDEYTAILDRLPLNQRLNGDGIEKAKKYAYHFFFRRMIPLSFMKLAAGNPPFTLAVSEITELLEGCDAGLDVIANGILNRTDFILKAENKCLKQEI